MGSGSRQRTSCWSHCGCSLWAVSAPLATHFTADAGFAKRGDRAAASSALRARRRVRESFASEVERILGRRVTGFMSEVHEDPPLAVEIFVLERESE
jgi:hypothetical protein